MESWIPQGVCKDTWGSVKCWKILEENNLYIKESKCYWEVDEVPVLGHIVGKGCLQMEATKVKTILEWEMPEKGKMSRSSMVFVTSITAMSEDIQRLPALSCA